MDDSVAVHSLHLRTYDRSKIRDLGYKRNIYRFIWPEHTLCEENPEPHKDLPVDTDLSQEHCPSAESADHEYSAENT